MIYIINITENLKILHSHTWVDGTKHDLIFFLSTTSSCLPHPYGKKNLPPIFFLHHCLSPIIIFTTVTQPSQHCGLQPPKSVPSKNCCPQKLSPPKIAPLQKLLHLKILSPPLSSTKMLPLKTIATKICCHWITCCLHNNHLQKCDLQKLLSPNCCLWHCYLCCYPPGFVMSALLSLPTLTPKNDVYALLPFSLSTTPLSTQQTSRLPSLQMSLQFLASASAIIINCCLSPPPGVIITFDK